MRRQADPTDYVRFTTGCGVDKTVGKGATEWLLDRHAHRHNKGIDGLSAGGCEISIEPVPAPSPLPRVLEPEESAEPAPDPTRLPDGTPHPNQLLAELGWQVQGGWYTRQREANREPGE